MHNSKNYAVSRFVFALLATLAAAGFFLGLDAVGKSAQAALGKNAAHSLFPDVSSVKAFFDITDILPLVRKALCAVSPYLALGFESILAVIRAISGS